MENLMGWQNGLNGNPLPWLLEEGFPGVRYLAMRDLLDLPADDPQLLQARAAAHRQGPISEVLSNMHPEGWWMEPGPGYNPKYRSTVWSLILLAQLGASIDEDERIAQACDYYLGSALTPAGQISASGSPSGTADCLQGNMIRALLSLGCTDPRLEKAFGWMARSVTGEGIAPSTDKIAPVRYYAGKCGPLFACGSNDRKPCAWGAVKGMLALAKIPASRRTPVIERAIQQGTDFLFSVDLTTAAWPSPYSVKPSGNWWKFGFPVFYVTDLLQVAEALVELGYGRDERMQGLIDLVHSKQGADGRWLLEYDYTDKTWGDYGIKKQPNPWVTLLALRVLKKAAI
jgi:hypothetical protein